MSKSNKDVKRNVLPHSKAKLDLYKSYISMYLPILGFTPYVTAINVFDIFCGTGVYDDGNLGSPLIAASCIQEYESKVNNDKPVRLYINDFDKDKVQGVKELISRLNLKRCQVQDFNLDASEMFKIVSAEINSYPLSERSLVFIDPYGYSKITKDSIYQILQKGKSEIILFLPVAHMKRFTEGALNDLDNKAYENLRRFIIEFLPTDSPIKQGQKLKIFDYIEELRNAFSFEDTFYTASHYIERDRSNYYALFFIGSHIFGLEKFIEAKWSNASLGVGFNQRDTQATLFGEKQQEVDYNISLDKLEKLFRELLNSREEITNLELYEFTLRNQFKPSHIKDVVKEWVDLKRIVIKDANGNVFTSKRSSFGLTYECFKEKKVDFKFKKR